MWVAKITFSGDKALLGSRCKKYSIRLLGYPISIFHRRNEIDVLTAFFLFGEQKNIDKFVRELKKCKRIMNIEASANFVLCHLREPSKNSVAYSNKIFHVGPVLIDKSGQEIWTVGSWTKDELMQFLDLVERDYNGKLLSVKNKKIDNFSVLAVNPSITKNQRDSIELAINKGYYDYPRKATLRDLARQQRISYSTYHAHLRKAEQRLLPFLFSKNLDTLNS